MRAMLCRLHVPYQRLIVAIHGRLSSWKIQRRWRFELP
jgi:hypothetical protein